jgi:hypothetical protein
LAATGFLGDVDTADAHETGVRPQPADERGDGRSGILADVLSTTLSRP